MELISKDIILCSLLPCFTVDAIDILNMNKVILINLIIKSCFHNVPKVYSTDTEKVLVFWFDYLLKRRNNNFKGN